MRFTYVPCYLMITGKQVDAIGGFKMVLALSLLLETAGYIGYSFAHNKWVLLGSRFISGFGAGNVSVARAAIAKVTTVKYRTRALAWSTAAQTIGVVVGPLIATLFDGLNIGDMKTQFFYLNTYNAPSLVAALAVLLNIVFVCVLLPADEKTKTQEGKNLGTADDIRKPSSYAVFTCLLIMWTANVAFSLFETIVTPLSHDMYDWQVPDTGRFYSVMALIATVSIFTVKSVGPKIGERHVLLIGLFLMIGGAVTLITFGNDSLELWRFWTGFTMLLGFGHPFVMICVYAVYSMILGKAPQVCEHVLF
jgi:DHA1 family multidrug resistance protein-like MFS transporter